MSPGHLIHIGPPVVLHLVHFAINDPDQITSELLNTSYKLRDLLLDA